MAAAAAADVQGAVVETGIEVIGKMVDKQLQIIDEAQEKAENFLKKEVRLSYPNKHCKHAMDCLRVQPLPFISEDRRTRKSRESQGQCVSLTFLFSLTCAKSNLGTFSRVMNKRLARK